MSNLEPSSTASDHSSSTASAVPTSPPAAPAAAPEAAKPTPVAPGGLEIDRLFEAMVTLNGSDLHHRLETTADFFARCLAPERAQ